MRRDEVGHIISIPNSISLGPYNGRIIYPGQSARCFICQGPDHQARECPTIRCWKCGELDHQARECPTVKCWKCGELGHKAKICQNESECSLCGAKGQEQEATVTSLVRGQPPQTEQ
uniref:CCHC-type domain-containing protein n=1 Tax=Maylandia zebra TaxID=106582 RepID=A0A3P9AX67_9CICH